MGRRLLSILLAALAIAGICAYLVSRVVNSHGSDKPASTKVVAANTDVKVGAILTPLDVTTTEIVGSLPKGVILDAKNAVGRGVTSDLYKGEPILESRLAAPGSGGGLAPTIPAGMRACAVKVDEVVGVAGFATPGMRVDVLFSGIPPGNQGASQDDTVSRTVLQYIQVLSAGQDFQRDPDGKARPVQVVNLLVTPEQAELLSLANGKVKIQLVLRNPLDTAIKDVAMSSLINLFEDKTKVVAPPVKKQAAPKVVHTAPPEPYTVEVINGSTVNKEKIASPEGKQ
jgi:pilus assembly protein CpaB